MELTIQINEHSDEAKKLLNLINELGLSFTKQNITAKIAAFGIGRKASDEELDEYLDRCMKGSLTDLDALL